MSGGFKNKPKIMRGAFVEFGLSLPPLVVVFQFNPLQLRRNRSLTFSAPSTAIREERNTQAGRERVEENTISLRNYHQRDEYSDLSKLRDEQQVSINEESIGLDLRLDATDEMNDGNPIVGQFGILPRLATLEMMVHPKGESLIGKALGNLLGPEGGFSFTRGENPPMILFIWGYTRVLPVNINSMNITETEFNTILNPVRATVSVSLTVIEGKNIPYTYSKAAKEAMSVINLANIAEIANVVIPG